MLQSSQIFAIFVYNGGLTAVGMKRSDNARNYRNRYVMEGLMTGINRKTKILTHNGQYFMYIYGYRQYIIAGIV